jgi:uncharacterized protein (DUF58 family)
MSGTVFILISIVLGILALNSGNNFHYLAAALVLGYTTAAGESAKRNIRGVSIALSFPDEIYARTPFSLTVEARNSKKRSAVTFLDVNVCGKSVFFPMIQPGKSERASLTVSLASRGLGLVDEVKISSIYPFNLFTCGLSLPCRERFVVYPQPIRDPSIAYINAEELDRSKVAIVKNQKQESIANSDITGVRPYVEGDSMRIIHWKSSARTGALKSRLFENQGGGKIIDLDRLIITELERGLSAACHEIRNTIGSGEAIGLSSRGVIHAPSLARSDKLSMLKALALYE